MPEGCQHPESKTERFYRAFWRSRQWGAAEANEDERSRLAAIEALLQRCDLPARPRILDLGCGRGWLTRELTRYGEVLGTDPTAASVERARELFPDLSFGQSDLRGLLEAHGAESFDLVVSSEVIEHVEDSDKRGFVAGIHRLLAPGGYAILTTPRGELRDSWRASREAGQPVEAWISEVALDALARGVGFRVEERTRAHVYGITPLSRVHASRPFRAAARLLPVLDRLTLDAKIYQVVLLRRMLDGEDPADRADRE